MTEKPVRIMIVEDESIVAMDLKNSLNALGYEVVGTANCGEEAIAKADQTRPALILMDIILKGEMDGIQASEVIHSTLDVPIIFLTACADERTLQRAKITEPLAYLLKPFEEWELRGHIEIALYRHKMEKKLRESEERYSLATQGSNDGLWDWDLKTKEIYLSPRWKSMLGYEEEQIGHSPEEWFKRLHPGDRDQVQKLLAQHLIGKTGHFESEYRILDASGVYRWALCRGLALRDAEGKAYRIAGSQTDITDRKVYNPITGLPNRILLMDRLERALGRAKRGQSNPFAVLALDVGGLKKVSDTLGYIAADQLLVQAATRIQGCMSAEDTIAHCGDDEFVLLKEKIRDAGDAMRLASQLHCELEKPFQLDGQTVYVVPTTGITLSTREYNSPDEFLRDASTAMRRAKSAGKCRCEIFDREMRSLAVAHLKLESDFRRALEERQFRVHYQPIVCLSTGVMRGFEALVRWQRPERLMFPEDFLAFAESTGLIIPLERFVLLEACGQLARWKSQFQQPLTVNVNLCAQHYSSPDLIKFLQQVLQNSGLDPASLRLEVTESALMEDCTTISETLMRIQDMNIQVHMDDFGTGYSSLSCLHRLPIQTLKIDRSFVGKLGLSDDTWKIVQAIVSLAHNLGMEVIAEGIENLMQMKMLQNLRCNCGQGYYFSKPISSDIIESMLSKKAPWSAAFKKEDFAVFPFAMPTDSHPSGPYADAKRLAAVPFAYL